MGEVVAIVNQIDKDILIFYSNKDVDKESSNIF